MENNFERRTMDAIIDRKGILHIKRRNGYKEAWCFRHVEEKCGDHCSGFYESMPGEHIIERRLNCTQLVQTCCGHIYNIVTDERESEGESNENNK